MTDHRRPPKAHLLKEAIEHLEGAHKNLVRLTEEYQDADIRRMHAMHESGVGCVDSRAAEAELHAIAEKVEACGALDPPEQNLRSSEERVYKGNYVNVNEYFRQAREAVARLAKGQQA